VLGDVLQYDSILGVDHEDLSKVVGYVGLSVALVYLERGDLESTDLFLLENVVEDALQFPCQRVVHLQLLL
jgi:hypothetical protein